MEEFQSRRKDNNGLQETVPDIEKRDVQLGELQRKKSNVQIIMVQIPKVKEVRERIGYEGSGKIK